MIDRVTSNWRLASLALLVVLAIVASGCSAAALSSSATGGSSASGAPPMASAEPTTAVVTPTATPSVTASPTSIASAAASNAALADGEYVSGVVTHAMAEVMLKDPAVAGAAGVKSFLAEFTTTLVSTLRLKNPNWVQLEREMAKTRVSETAATYAFVDDHTIAFQGNSNRCVSTYSFSSHADELDVGPAHGFMRTRRRGRGSGHLPIHRLDPDALRCSAIGVSP